MIEANVANTQSALEKWRELITDVPETQPGAPITVLTGEAIDLAYFLEEHWEPSIRKDRPLPGLKDAVRNDLITEQTPLEIFELGLAVTNAHSKFRRLNPAELEAPVERGTFLLFELKHSLKFLFDDGKNDERDAELKRLSESHSDTDSHDGLAQSLEGFALFAHDHRDELATLPEFDPNFIDEAMRIAQALRAQSALKLSDSTREEQSHLLSVRNRLITLLRDRVNAARRAARYVFRNHPGVAYQAGSAYERRKRARREAHEAEAVQEVTATA